MNLTAAYELITKMPADEHYTWSCSRAFRRELVSWFADVGSRLRAVEIGTYRGLTTLVLSYVFASVVSIDVNQTMLKVAAARSRDRNNIRYVYANTAKDAWWRTVGNADILLVDGDHVYDAALLDIESGIRHLDSLQWVIIDDYGAVPDIAFLVEEFISSGKLIDCKALGRRSGERIPLTGLSFNGPEAVLCTVPRASERNLLNKLNEDRHKKENVILDLNGKTFSICLAPCNTIEHHVSRDSGVVNFTDVVAGGRGLGDANRGSVIFSSFLGGGRGYWHQPRPGALLVDVAFKHLRYYFMFVPDLIAFQAYAMEADGAMGEAIFKATRVSVVSWFNDEDKVYRADAFGARVAAF